MLRLNVWKFQKDPLLLQKLCELEGQIREVKCHVPWMKQQCLIQIQQALDTSFSKAASKQNFTLSSLSGSFSSS